MRFSLLQGAKKHIQLVLKVPARAPLPEGVATNIGAAMVPAAGQRGTSATASAEKSQGISQARYKPSKECSSPKGSARVLGEGKESSSRLEAVAVTPRGEPPGGGMVNGSGACAAAQCVAGDAPVAAQLGVKRMLELPQQLAGTMHTWFRPVRNKLYLLLRFNRKSSRYLGRFKAWKVLGLEKVSISNGNCSICAWCAVSQ
jgi:hypothetical protein